MPMAGLEPNDYSYSAVISACERGPAKARRMVNAMRRAVDDSPRTLQWKCGRLQRHLQGNDWSPALAWLELLDDSKLAIL